MPYYIGELDQLVSIQREARTADSMGGASVAWTTVANVRALVRPMSGREVERAQKVGTEAMYLVVIYRRDDVRESDTILWNGIRLNIRVARHRPRSLFLELEAERGVAT